MCICRDRSGQGKRVKKLKKGEPRTRDTSDCILFSRTFILRSLIVRWEYTLNEERKTNYCTVLLLFFPSHCVTDTLHGKTKNRSTCNSNGSSSNSIIAATTTITIIVITRTKRHSHPKRIHFAIFYALKHTHTHTM